MAVNISLIIKTILFSIASTFIFLGTAANIGGDTDPDDVKGGKQMMTWAWNALKVTGSGPLGLSDTGVFLGFHARCAYGCGFGECGGACINWADGGDQEEGTADFCDNEYSREGAENSFNAAIRAFGGGSGKADGFADAVCACFGMKEAVPALLFLSGVMLLADFILSCARMCADDGSSKGMYIASMILSAFGAIFALAGIMAYGIGCNLATGYPEAVMAWAAGENAGVAGIVAYIAAGQYGYVR